MAAKGVGYFGHGIWGAHYWNPHYWGGGVASAPAPTDPTMLVLARARPLVMAAQPREVIVDDPLRGPLVVHPPSTRRR